MGKEVFMTSKQKAIKEAIKSSGSTMHLGKKGAPGIMYNKLTPKEKHYRNSNEKRTNKRLSDFHKSGYGQHLHQRSIRRGEEDL